jgi:twitching motility protein PilU
MGTTAELDAMLTSMAQNGASDLFLTAGIPPTFKINGRMLVSATAPLTSMYIRTLLFQIMSEDQQKQFTETMECNFALARPDIGRFRVNVFQQKFQVGMVLRKIETDIPTLEQLGLPPLLAELSMARRGLVIVVGATGAGKSTTLAAMIGHRNREGSGHIVTVEDPIEFIHEHDRCVITQREVGVDTQSFENALKNTLRQTPDVILVGEVRTRETMQQVITFAETGHLCVTTLHANNANQALERILNFFPEDRRGQLLLDLSLNLKAIIAQQLIPTPDHRGRRLALEILLNTPLVSQLIQKGELHKIKDLMKKSGTLGMQTFDQSLQALYNAGEISYEDALHHADAPNELRLLIKLGKDGDAERTGGALKGVTIVPREL